MPAELPPADARLRLLAEGGNVGFWSYRAATQQLLADAACCQLLHCGSVATLEALLAGLGAADGAAMLQDIQRAIAEQGSFQRIFCLPNGAAQVPLSMRGRWQAAPAGGCGELLCVVERAADGQVNGAISVAAGLAEVTAREARLLAIFDRAPLAISVARASDGMLVMVNASFLRLHGCCQEEVIGSSIEALQLWHPPGSRQQMLQAFAADGHVRNMVMGFRDKAGRTGRGLLSVEAIDIGGESLLVGMLSDISALEDARQALALSEARYKLLSESSFEGVGLSKNGMVLDANAQLAELLGVTREQLIGQPVTRLMLPADAARAGKVMASGGYSHNEYSYLRPDGRQVLLEVNSRDLLHNGEPLRISALRDVTDKRRQERILHELQLRFSRMMESNVVGIFIAGPAGEILEANDYFLNLLGLRREALQAGQLNWMRLTVPSSLELTLQQVQRMQASGGSLPYEKEYWHADGHRVAALVALSQISSDPVRGVVIVVDISALKAAQDALLLSNAQLLERTLQAERAEAAKTLFLSTVSHELRTPLHSVLGYARLLAKGASGEALQQLAVVEHNSKQLLRLIDDLLEFNHSSIAPEQLLPELVVLDGLLAHLESIGRAAAAESGNQFVCQLGADLPAAILVDEGRLVQVLRILIDNACKYTQAGVVVLALSAEGQASAGPGRCRLRFAVEDSGRGIDDADMARIFEPLSRGSNTGDRPGLGLGLAIAAQWVWRMGSTIAVQSDKGLGSHFSFVLELEIAPAPAPTHPGAPRLYAVQADSASAPVAPASASPLQALPADALAALGQLLDMGRLGRLRHWAEALCRLHPEQREAAQRVSSLAADADIAALEKMHRRWAALATNTQGPRPHNKGNSVREKRCLNVAVVEDDASTLHAICAMVESLGHAALAFDTAKGLVAARQSGQPDVLVLDLSMPDLDGFELLYQLAQRLPLEPVIISSSQPAAIIQAASIICKNLGFAVLGILPKPFASDELAFLLNPLALGQVGQPH